MTAEAPSSTISRLQARVARLEKLLAERSRMLRVLARGACEEDLEAMSRIAAGRPLIIRTGVGLFGWQETTQLVSCDIEATMTSLWRSVAPFHVPEEK